MARIVEAIGRWRSGALSCMEAAEVLGMSERHFRRLRDRYEAEGAEGLIDRRRGRVSGRRVPVDRIEWVLDQFRTRYFDLTVKHFHEQLVAEHRFALGYTWTKRVLQDAGLVRRARKRSAHRRKRPRRPLSGMLLFQACPRAGAAGPGGRLAPRLARRAAGARPDRHAQATWGRRHERGLLGAPGSPRRLWWSARSGAPGRRGGHGLELCGPGRGDRAPRPVLRALH